MGDLINAVHRFRAKRQLNNFDGKSLLIVTTASDSRTMTRDAYVAYIKLMTQDELATHSVSELDCVMIDSMPDGLSHIWTLEDISGGITKVPYDENR